MGEDLDHLLAIDGLFDEAVHVAQLFLLADEVAAGGGSQALDDDDQQEGESQDEEGQGDGDEQHGHEGGDDAHDRREHLGQALGDGLAQGVGVVGVEAHDVPMQMGVEILDRQGLLVGEHVVPNGLEHPLFHLDQDPVVGQGGDDPGGEDDGQHSQSLGQGEEIRMGLAHLGHDVGVDQGLQEKAHGRVGRGGDDDAEHHHDHLPFVGEDVGEEAGGGPLPWFVFLCVFHGRSFRFFLLRSARPFCLAQGVRLFTHHRRSPPNGSGTRRCCGTPGRIPRAAHACPGRRSGLHSS